MNLRCLFVSLLFVSSCQLPTNEATTKTYFDLKGFIDIQIKELNEHKPWISKKLTIGEKQEQIRVRITDWAEELELFRDADINKPAFQQSYDIIKPDSLTVEYRLKPSEKLPVRFLKISFDEGKQVVGILAKISQSNYLLASEKSLSIQFNAFRRRGSLLKSYQIGGHQHLKMFDDDVFDISGEVIY